VVDPLAYGYAAILRRTAANAGDMDFVQSAGLSMVVLPLLPPMEAIGRIGWWLYTGAWLTTEGSVVLGRKVGVVFPFGIVVLMLVAFYYYRSRESLVARFSSFPIPTTRQVAASLFGVAGASIVMTLLCLDRPTFGLALYLAMFLATSWLLSRIEPRPG
jgi:hypothetical protein